MPTGLETKTPAEIDTDWAPIEGRLGNLSRYMFAYDQSIAKARTEVERERATRNRDEYAAHIAPEIAKLKADLLPMQAEWDARKGWARFVFCNSDGGHVHSLPCSTLRATSSLSWLPELSGLTETQMVESVGFKACTVCFPTAPTHPAWARTEKAAQSAKAADKDAKYAKGLALREKKVANITKRIAKATANLLSSDDYTRSSAAYDLDWNRKDLVWAQRELDRWIAKRS